MTVCTPHSYAGPKECPYCQLALCQRQGLQMAVSYDEMSAREDAALARIAELEAALAACGLGIIRAVAELENHVLPLCSEEGEIEHAVQRALEALR